MLRIFKTGDQTRQELSDCHVAVRNLAKMCSKTGVAGSPSLGLLQHETGISTINSLYESFFVRVLA